MSTTIDKLNSLIDQFNELTSKSVESLNTNHQLSLEWHQIQNKLIEDEHRIEELQTKYENSSIFLQHLTSLSLRSEFLESQLHDTENQKCKSITATKNQGLKEFKEWKQQNLNWRTTETTFENLTMEYQYLTEQLKIANDDVEDEFISPSMVNSTFDTSDEVSANNNEDSLFSNIIEDSDLSNSTLDDILERTPVQQATQEQKKRRLMKKESFLTIPYNQPVFEIPDADLTPIRGFNIDSRRQSLTNSGLVKKKQNQRMTSAGLHIIEEHIDELPNQQLEYNEIGEEEEEKEALQLQNQKIASKVYHHKRHISLPDTPNVEFILQTVTDETPVDRVSSDWLTTSTKSTSSTTNNNSFESQNLRHFASYDTGLNKSKRKFDLEGFQFLEKLSRGESSIPRIADIEAEYTQSSSPLSTIKHSYINDDEDDENNYEEEHDDDVDGKPSMDLKLISSDIESEENFGVEDVTPFVFDTSQKPLLRKSNSHESIFSTYRSNLRQEPSPSFTTTRACPTTDLKAQTLKWLTPNQPVVSSYSASSVGSEVVVQPTRPIQFRSNSTTKDMLNSVVNRSSPTIAVGSSSFSSIQRSKSIPTTIPVSQTPTTPLSMSWLPSSLFYSNTDDEINLQSSVQPMQPEDSPSLFSSSSKSNWLANLLPNTSMVMSETGKLIGQPSSYQPTEEIITHKPNQLKKQQIKTDIKKKSNTNNNRSNSNNNKVRNSHLFKKVDRTVSFSGSHSTMFLGKNGNKIIRHGPGSGMNDSSVLSSRVSHSALRDALDSSFS
ncbi:hypothetical protein CANARDRAFT_24471 [[Candida] arabinofermentans NRRL YB-2248]|uniref:Uncharacterized protein n=1 Tax=[Candida] arabinofermentans NRRL YB-2248 TaxID=983967 RepID=A0A1E4SX41_9ASCO|nr:hypothetical protein CANARDRAFT_24471 [[Candida] arabinofermentans NRRL YB-2248]